MSKEEIYVFNVEGTIIALEYSSHMMIYVKHVTPLSLFSHLKLECGINNEVAMPGRQRLHFIGA